LEDAIDRKARGEIENVYRCTTNNHHPPFNLHGLEMLNWHGWPMFFIDDEIAKGLAVSATPVCYITNQITKIDLCKKNKRKIQITDAKVRGFWADSKKLARFLSKLLRQGNEIATK
jgi:hypothetical protein